MDSMYLVHTKRTINRDLIEQTAEWFDTLTEAIACVNKYADDPHTYDRIVLQWGDSVLLALFNT